MQIKLFVHIRSLFAYNAYYMFICIFSAYLPNFQRKFKNSAFAVKMQWVAKSIRYEFPNIDYLIGEVQNVFVKAPCYKKALASAGQAPVPELCLMRWNKALVE